MAKKITVPVEYGYPYVKVIVNGKAQNVYTGKEVSVGDAIYDVLIRMMTKKNAHEDSNSENFRIKFPSSSYSATTFAPLIALLNTSS